MISFMLWAAEHAGFASLRSIVEAPASAELEPVTAEHKQISEEDMGLSFAELGVFGMLQFVGCLCWYCIIML